MIRYRLHANQQFLKYMFYCHHFNTKHRRQQYSSAIVQQCNSATVQPVNCPLRDLDYHRWIRYDYVNQFIFVIQSKSQFKFIFALNSRVILSILWEKILMADWVHLSYTNQCNEWTRWDIFLTKIIKYLKTDYL